MRVWRSKLGVLLISGAWILPASGDEILWNGKTIHRAQIVGYEQGVIEYRTNDGWYDKAPLWEVEYLVIDSIAAMDNFNAAEEYLVKNQPAQAVDRYERAMRAGEGQWVDIARVRLLIATDRARFFEKSVRTTLTIAAREPRVAAELLPTAFPAQADRATQRSLNRIEEALQENLTGSARSVLEILRYAVLRRIDPEQAAGLAPEIAKMAIPQSVLTSRTAAVKTDALRTLFQSGAVDETLAALDQALADAPHDFVPIWQLLKAEALLSTATNDDDYMAAASAAMRVAVRYADHAAGGDGLLLAAQAHEASGRPADAVRLLRECLRRNAVDAEIKGRAREALNRLTGSEPSDT